MDLTEADELCGLARECVQSQDFDTARQYFSTVVDGCPGHTEGWEGLATSLVMLHEFEEAIVAYQQLTTLEPAMARHYINLGGLYNRIGDYPKAIEVLRKAIHRDRRNADAYYNQAYAFRKMGQLSLAATAYKDAIKMNPSFVEAHHNLGNIFLEQGSLQQAADCFRRSLELDPNFQKAIGGLARIDEAIRANQAAAQSAFTRMTEATPPPPTKRSSSNRELSLQERITDRKELHKLCGEAESIGEQCADFLRSSVETAFHELQKEVAQPGKSRHLDAAVLRFQRVVEQWGLLRQTLRRKCLEIRAHEEIMNTPEMDLASLQDLFPKS